jgi:Flp pilus assembly protein TadD
VSRVANIFLAALLVCFMAAGMPEQQSSANLIEIAARMIFQGRYNEAIGKLEQVLETAPQQPEAMTYLATAQLYLEGDFLKAQKRFEEAYRAGGGASFLVNQNPRLLIGTNENLALAAVSTPRR